MKDQEVPASDLPDNLSGSSGQEVPANDLPDSASGEEVPASDLPKDHSTLGQKALTVIEGLGRGATAGASDAVDVGLRNIAPSLRMSPDTLAPDPKEVLARKEANPLLAGASELAGNFGMLSRLPQFGSKAIDGLIKMGIIGGGDELSKAMLGQGDPATAVASHIAESGAVGLLGGALFGKIESLGPKALKAIEDTKIGTKVKSFLSGVGHAATIPGFEPVALENSSLLPDEASRLHNKSFMDGQKFYKGLGTTAALGAGNAVGGPTGITMAPFLEKMLGPAVGRTAQKYVAPAILKASASGAINNLTDIVDHATTCSAGYSKINSAIQNLFNSTSNKAVEIYDSEKDRKKVKDFIDKGGVDEQIRSEAGQQGIPTQSFAKGGTVSPETPNLNPVAQVFPEQNNLISSTKGRVSTFLNSIKPTENMPKLPFDKAPKNKQEMRDYDKAIDLANNPLSILNKVKSGTLLPTHMKAFTSMYPELHSELSKQMTKKISEIQADESKRPKYHTRQAMSLFLGASLDSTMTPQNIMAAQSVFAQQKAQMQAPAKKGSDSGMSKVAQAAMTPAQAREKALNKT